MTVSTMVRRGLFALVGAGIVACADSTSAPTARPRLAPSQTRVSAEEYIRARGQNQGSAQFTLDPNVGGVLAFGGNTVTFPAGSICDPASSGYGESFWDAPCTPLATPIGISAIWSQGKGAPTIVFYPDLRFVPSADPNHWVTISMALNGHEGRHAVAILSQRSTDLAWINDAELDPTLRTYECGDDGTALGSSRAIHERSDEDSVCRRIKHFSGYVVSAGSDTTTTLTF